MITFYLFLSLNAISCDSCELEVVARYEPGLEKTNNVVTE